MIGQNKYNAKEREMLGYELIYHQPLFIECLICETIEACNTMDHPLLNNLSLKVRLIYLVGSWKIIYTDLSLAERCVWDVSANRFGRESVVLFSGGGCVTGKGSTDQCLALNRNCDFGPVFFLEKRFCTVIAIRILKGFYAIKTIK